VFCGVYALVEALLIDKKTFDEMVRFVMKAMRKDSRGRNLGYS
jgi:hypothetical protein